MNAGESLEKQLLQLVQAGVPVVARPFAEIGRAIGASEEEVLATLTRLKTERKIRQISAIFDTRSLGYASSLVACKCDPSRVDEAAAVISAHPGVSHNYLRNHAFNLWYTIAVAPTSRLGLERTVEWLHRESGAESTRLLPTLKLFKIGVQLDVAGESRPYDQTAPSYTEQKRVAAAKLGGLEIEFVRLMQQDLPLTPEPFLDYARALRVSLDQLQAMHDQMARDGRLRRFAAVLNHRRVGFSANAMGVWAVRRETDAEVDRVGEVMAQFRAVSHCYKRPSYPDWPYNIFTMVHGRSPEECEEVLRAISEKTREKEYQALYSTKEYKKVRVQYFTREEEDWERERLG